MRVTVHESVAAFDAAAGPLYAADPVRHTLAHTVLDRLRDRPDRAALLVTVARAGETVGALLQEVRRPAVASALPPGLAAAVAERAGTDLPAVNGEVPQAEAFAAAYTARTGRGSEVAMRMRLFRLVALTPPPRVPGCARVAGPADVDLVARWQAAFGAEAIRSLGPPADARPGVVESMERGGGHLLWEVDGRPVAYAAARRPVGPMSRVGPVYTPPEHRGHGYGSAVTAAATAWAQDAGAREVVLFTDLANPVSNAIYPRIGYRPVLDALELTFTERA
ncbi:GNAT family N-acetyltransferase [Pseudonocardia petroleophila]|uniref:GNAT family N-acetyltransferase n=1 Tax=Pseudonocardia petroleophila TaxID=37331 RepID=A0A7G7MHV3_9PSEU|nr:GNAT family N-acetyltransferase [Pseudonocardia petroleophila]QNG52364.1 GNAT family N-acetyltransferase [Pseudonocardia petroleophila]